MITIDTNIVVRYVMRDDLRQAQKAQDFLRQHECLIIRTVVLELVWVLSAGYKLSREKVIEHVRHILCLPTVFTEDVDNVLLALQWYESGMDFADALHLAVSLVEADGFATFDKGITKSVNRLGIQHIMYSL